VKKPKTVRKTQKKAELRKTITPGTVLILLAGQYRAKRVVFLKQLESGLLLVTGPYKVNGVPLRRVNQAYVIATSTKVDISNVKLDAKINDEYFKMEKREKDGEKRKVQESRVKDQKSVDTQVLAAIKKTPVLKKYLNARFALSKGQFPHQMKF
jgi:large subunit ribosomal protein L6e